jgi:hypothetical protein
VPAARYVENAGPTGTLDLSTFRSDAFPFVAAFFALFAAFFAIFLILPGFVILYVPFPNIRRVSSHHHLQEPQHIGTARRLPFQAVFKAPAFSSLKAWKSTRQSSVPRPEPPLVRGAARHSGLCVTEAFAHGQFGGV